eukprot:COSAG01_NODE_1313_length_10770_cov_14.047887_5_plen_360_part_00
MVRLPVRLLARRCQPAVLTGHVTSVGALPCPRYVRANHVQTDADFLRLYPRNKAILGPPLRCPAPLGQPVPSTKAAVARGGGAAKAKKASKRQEKVAEKARKLRRRAAPKLLTLVGLPGCGKSSFARRLAASDPSGGGWVHADSDELRRGMDSVVGRHAGRRRVIVDKCNVEPRERVRWLSLAHGPAAEQAMLVVFGAGAEECIERVLRRGAAHPTIDAASHPTRAAAIVRSFARRWSVPADAAAARAEGYGRFALIRSFAEADDLLVQLGADPQPLPAQPAVSSDTPGVAGGGGGGGGAGLALVRTASAEERGRRVRAERQALAAEQQTARDARELARVQDLMQQQQQRHILNRQLEE